MTSYDQRSGATVPQGQAPSGAHYATVATSNVDDALLPRRYIRSIVADLWGAAGHGAPVHPVPAIRPSVQHTVPVESEPGMDASTSAPRPSGDHMGTAATLTPRRATKQHTPITSSHASHHDALVPTLAPNTHRATTQNHRDIHELHQPYFRHKTSIMAPQTTPVPPMDLRRSPDDGAEDVTVNVDIIDLTPSTTLSPYRRDGASDSVAPQPPERDAHRSHPAEQASQRYDRATTKSATADFFAPKEVRLVRGITVARAPAHTEAISSASRVPAHTDSSSRPVAVLHAAGASRPLEETVIDVVGRQRRGPDATLVQSPPHPPTNHLQSPSPSHFQIQAGIAKRGIIEQTESMCRLRIEQEQVVSRKRVVELVQDGMRIRHRRELTSAAHREELVRTELSLRRAVASDETSARGNIMAEASSHYLRSAHLASQRMTQDHIKSQRVLQEGELVARRTIESDEVIARGSIHQQWLGKFAVAQQSTLARQSTYRIMELLSLLVQDETKARSQLVTAEVNLRETFGAWYAGMHLQLALLQQREYERQWNLAEQQVARQRRREGIQQLELAEQHARDAVLVSTTAAHEHLVIRYEDLRRQLVIERHGAEVDAAWRRVFQCINQEYDTRNKIHDEEAMIRRDKLHASHHALHTTLRELRRAHMARTIDDTIQNEQRRRQLLAAQAFDLATRFEVQSNILRRMHHTSHQHQEAVGEQENFERSSIVDAEQRSWTLLSGSEEEARRLRLMMFADRASLHTSRLWTRVTSSLLQSEAEARGDIAAQAANERSLLHELLRNASIRSMATTFDSPVDASHLQPQVDHLRIEEPTIFAYDFRTCSGAPQQWIPALSLRSLRCVLRPRVRWPSQCRRARDT